MQFRQLIGQQWWLLEKRRRIDARIKGISLCLKHRVKFPLNLVFQ